MVKTLLFFADCDVNAKGLWGRTALHYACQNNHVACIHELIAGGAEIESRSSDRATPLHLAADFNRSDSVKTLVDVYKHQSILPTGMVAQRYTLQLTAGTLTWSEFSCHTHSVTSHSKTETAAQQQTRPGVGTSTTLRR